MARRPRLCVTGVPQHVIQRGNNRLPTFFAERDYQFYLDCLCDAVRKYGCRVHAYVLMTNHVHLLATPFSREGISKVMQHLGRRYVQYVNYTYRRSGTLWEGRFKASLVDSERYFLMCCRYIELNPVRARMVGRPQDYRWSSYRCNALGAADHLISAHDQYELLGTSEHERRQAYQELFRRSITETDLEMIRTTANEGWPLGSDRFKDEIEGTLGRAARAPKRGRPAKAGDECTNNTECGGMLLRPH